MEELGFLTAQVSLQHPSLLAIMLYVLRTSQVALVVRTRLPVQETLRDGGSSLGSGRCPAGRHGNPPRTLAGELEVDREPGRLQFIG